MSVYLKELPAHLSRITPDRWKDLFDLIPTIEEIGSFGQEEGEHGAVHPSKWAKIVVRLHEYVIGNGLIVDFDWVDWEEFAHILSEEANDLEDLPPVTLCKLLTAIVRSDRADDVHLATHFENGNMLKILRGLEKHFG